MSAFAAGRRSRVGLFVVILAILVAVFVVIVLGVVAVVLRGEGCAVFGVGDGANGADGEMDLSGVGRGDLQAVEEETRSFGVDLVGGESLDDIDERELDGLGVLEEREVERCVLPGCRLGAGADGIGAVVDGLDGRLVGVVASGRCG